jgi:hypothetical protein
VAIRSTLYLKEGLVPLSPIVIVHDCADTGVAFDCMKAKVVTIVAAQHSLVGIARRSKPIALIPHVIAKLTHIPPS